MAFGFQRRAEEMAAEAEARARNAEEARAAAEARAALLEAQLQQLETRLTAAEAERKLLLDRVVQMTGQPPIYAAPQTAPEPAAPANQPAPRRRVMFDDIHGAFREAEREGKLNLVAKA